MEPGDQFCIWGSHVPGLECPANAWWTNEAFRAHHSLRRNEFPSADDSWIEDRLFSQLAIEAVPVAHPLRPFLRRGLDALVPRPAAELPPVLPISGDSSAGESLPFGLCTACCMQLAQVLSAI